ncbi:MAG TPA: hypothetical protein VNO54_06700 [Streptosporangiaceae bacterium]|nr:hypothetical protein [Streptosporangiaceae bacterium]
MTALIKRPSGILERRELPGLDVADAIERNWHGRDGDGRLLLPNQPEYLTTRRIIEWETKPTRQRPT